MFKHLFKLIWNKKKENFLLISEILISFLVMFVVFSLMVNFYQNYQRPMGFEPEQVWSVDLGGVGPSKNKDSILTSHKKLIRTILSLPKVNAATFSSGNTPFADNVIRTGFGDTHHDISVDTYLADVGYAAVLHMNVLQGRWFGPEDNAARITPVVINQAAADQLASPEQIIGKVFGKKGENQKRVIGVVQDLKDKGDYRAVEPAIFNVADTGNVGGMSKLLLKVSPDADAGFEGKLYRLIANAEHNDHLEIAHLTSQQHSKNKEVLIPMVIILIIAGFLVFNVALGLFGVLWYNISKRKGEIGLRRAIGASAAAVSLQLVGEALVLSTISLMAGTFFALQFPLLHVFDLPASVYLMALLLSVLFIYLLVVVCALYPGKQAAAIQPAVALHED